VSAYKHYRNNAEDGVTLFVTTTVLDFVHSFRRNEMRDGMGYHLARECKLAGVALYGFVLMPHHIHMIVRLAPNLAGPDFMRAFKSNTAGAMRKVLIEPDDREFDQQRGLGRRQFWKSSYRSVKIERQMFWQKMEYMHLNPVKAGYVVDPEDYRWSALGSCWPGYGLKKRACLTMRG
jgi:REP element-mobilizing transposase RayT